MVASQQLQDVRGRTNHCWSFGSINHPSSQSRKISVGIMVDSSTKKTFESSKEDDITRVDAERVRTIMRSPSHGKGKDAEMAATKQPKQPEANPVDSPWIATKSIYQKGTTSRADPFSERNSDFPASGRVKLDGVKSAGLAYSDHHFTNDTSVLQLDDDKLNKFTGVTYERKKTHRTPEIIQEFTFATVQDGLMPNTEVAKNRENTAENGRTVSLRLRLQEILGTVSSPNDHCSKSPTHELGTRILNPEQNVDKMNNPVAKPRQSSDRQENISDQMGDALSNSRKTCDKGKQKSDQMGDALSNFRKTCDKGKQKSDQMGDALSKFGKTSDKGKQKSDQMGDALFKPRQNSDTIETDSDCPDHRFERPVTRSLTRRRAPTKMQKKTKKIGNSSGDKLKHQDKSVSSPEDGLPRGLHTTVSGSSSMSMKMKNEKKSRVKPVKLFHEWDTPHRIDERDVPDKIQQETHWNETPLAAQKAGKIHQVTHWNETPLPAQKSDTPSKTRDFESHGNISEIERQYPRVKENITNSNSQNSPLTTQRDYQHRDFVIPEKRDQQEDIDTPAARRDENFGSPSVRNFVNQPEGLRSPTLGVNTPVSSSSLSSMPKADLMGKVRGFRSLRSKKSDCYGDTETESSDDGEKLQDSLIRKTSSSMKEKKASPEEASFDERHLGSSGENSPSSDEFDRYGKSGAMYQERSTGTKVKFTPYPSKRLRSHEIDVQLNHTKIPSPSSTGNGENNWIHRSSGNNKVDGLTRALELLASELEKIKRKIKAATSKKSSDILMSVAEDVHLQLQNVESHIQTDMGKLKNLSKFKRKRVETRFEEQQERLQSIYVKFKEQINRYLEDCRMTFQGLEAEQMEFKTTLEKRKKSHGKLLLQVEEGIEILLNDAQRRVTATHECARGKMVELKQVLAMCLKEDILS